MQRTLLTPAQFTEKYPAFPLGGLRWLRFNSETNGFDSAFLKIGRKLLIDEEAFFKAVDAANGGRHV